MASKSLLFAGIVLLFLGGFYFLFYSTHSPLYTEELMDTSLDDKRHSEETVASLRKKYPHLQPRPVEWVESMLEKPTRTWDEWIDTNVELNMNWRIAKIWESSELLEKFDTPEKLHSVEANLRKFFEDDAEGWRNQGGTVVPPTVNDVPPDYLEALEKAKSPVRVAYEGPQTPEAIIDRFEFMDPSSDDRNSDTTSHLDSTWYPDSTYPKEKWIQDFLNKGAEFKYFGDYHKFVGSRAVFMNRSKDPSLWASGSYGIRPSSTLEEYKDAFIEREIWIQNTWNRVKDEHPDATGMAIEGDNYLPFKDNLTYVRRNGPATTTWGVMLSKEETEDLIMRGIHPKDIEIVYIDNDYNILSEKPSPWDPKSPDAKAITEKVLKEMIPEIRTFEASETPVGVDVVDIRDDPELVVPDVDLNAMRREAAREAATAAREAAKSEYEKFAGRMRQLESFSTMSDAEIEKQLERQFRKQFLPEHPIEQLEQITPERLERALGTLFQHGFEDGMRMIRKDNAALADTLERHFGKRAKPPAQDLKPPQRPAPPKPPSEPPAASDETQ